MSALLEQYELNHAAPSLIESDEQNKKYLATLSELIKRGKLSADDERYARLLSAPIHAYESKRYSVPDAKPHEVLAELIEQNGLKQRDLVPILGTESVVSEIVNGKRSLSSANIAKLSHRFNVSPAAFYPRVKSKAKLTR